MPSVNVNLKSFEFGTKLVATFVVGQVQHVQRFILLPTIDSVETSSGQLFYDAKDQLLGLSEYHGTIGPHDVTLDFANGVRIRATLATPMEGQVVVQVSERDTAEQRNALKKIFEHRADPFPIFNDGPKVGFQSTHVYVDYLLGPSPFFWPFRQIPEMATGTLARTSSSSRFVAKFDIDGVIYEFTADMVPSIQPFASKAALLTYNRGTTQLIGTQTFQGAIGISAATIIMENGVTITAVLDGVVDPASTICGAGHWNQA